MGEQIQKQKTKQKSKNDRGEDEGATAEYNKAARKKVKTRGKKLDKDTKDVLRNIDKILGP